MIEKNLLKALSYARKCYFEKIAELDRLMNGTPKKMDCETPWEKGPDVSFDDEIGREYKAELDFLREQNRVLRSMKNEKTN